MSIIINTNMGALYTQNSLNKALNSLNESVKRLSTGFKINSAKDDAAGYFIASKTDTQIRGLNIVGQSVQIAGNMLDTASGDLSNINNQLKEIRDLTVQFSSTIYGSDEREAIRAEVQQRVDEINRIASASNFNGVSLLDGSARDMRIQVGAGSDEAANSITVSDVFDAADAEGINLIGGSAQYTSVNDALADSRSAARFLSDIDTAIDDVTSRIASAGAYGSRLDSVVDSITVQKENLTSAYSTIMDADVAEESANVTKQEILAQTSLALLSQVNQLQSSMVLSLINAL